MKYYPLLQVKGKSRGNDKTVVEIKLSSNADYIHGYEEQIEQYAKSEGTTQRVFGYVKFGNPRRDKSKR